MLPEQITPSGLLERELVQMLVEPLIPFGLLERERVLEPLER